MAPIDHKLDPDYILNSPEVIRASKAASLYTGALNAAFTALGHTPSTRDWNWCVAYVVKERAEEDIEDLWQPGIESICKEAVDEWSWKYGRDEEEIESELRVGQALHDALDTQATVDGLAAATNAPPSYEVIGLMKLVSQDSLAGLPEFDSRQMYSPVAAASPPPTGHWWGSWGNGGTYYMDVDGVQVGVTSEAKSGDEFWVNGALYRLTNENGRIGYTCVIDQTGPREQEALEAHAASPPPTTTWFDVDGARIGVDNTNDIQDGDHFWVNGVEYAWQRMSDGRIGYVKVHQDSGCTSCGPGVPCRAGAMVKAYEAMAASPPPDDTDSAFGIDPATYEVWKNAPRVPNEWDADYVPPTPEQEAATAEKVRKLLLDPPPVVTTRGQCYVCDRVDTLVGRVCAGCRRGGQP